MEKEVREVFLRLIARHRAKQQLLALAFQRVCEWYDYPDPDKKDEVDYWLTQIATYYVFGEPEW